MDLEKFFDRVNHDKLRARVAGRVKDKRVLKLIRAELRPVRGRLQHLRRKQARGRKRIGCGDTLCGRNAETESEPGKECGRPAVDPQVPWFSVEPTGDDSASTEDDLPIQGEDPRDNEPDAVNVDGRTLYTP